jgi:tetratricopeptide (TPR) repeat protein
MIKTATAKQIASKSPEPHRCRSRRASSLFAAIFLALAASLAVAYDWWSIIPSGAPARFVGRKSCAECHPNQAEAFRGSHHDLAMDIASPETVLGDFSGVNFSHHGIESRLFRDGERYMVHTEGPDGKLDDFEVKYVFGVTPLQQYMVEFDRHPSATADECGRLQVLRISWDTSKKQWFYLPPPDVSERILPGDDLHWTGIAQRWNTMCADCHSTNFRKNFEVKSARYKSTFSEIDVSCEACHGAGGDHVDLARAWSLFWDRKHGKAIGGFKKADPELELAACLRCHSRRQMLTEDWRPGQGLSDVALVEGLSPLTYHADGQIKDEVYEHGAFLQSRMHAKGIRCSDCHDPHSIKLKHTGNQVCISCHQHSPGKYDSPAHHHHQPGGTGAQCVDCHMPSKTYMEIDVRRDHSFRVPRPDQSASLGTPNACTGCHINANPFVAEAKLPKLVDTTGESHLHPKPTDYHKLLELRSKNADIDAELKRLDAWAMAQVERWYGPKRERGAEYASELDAQWNHRRGAAAGLENVAAKRTFPAIIRASAWTQLGQTGSPSQKEIIAATSDPSPLVRAAACGAAQIHFPGVVDFLESGMPRREWITPRFETPIRQLGSAVARCLSDPVLSVRLEAARALAKLPSPLRNGVLSAEEQAAWEIGIEDWKKSMLLNNDRGGSHTALGVFYESQEEWTQAKTSYETAIRIEPSVVGPRSNLSILLERVANDFALPPAERRFQLDTDISEPALRASVLELTTAEADLLKRDAALAPQLAPLHYQYALALVRLKDYPQAQTALKRASEIEPDNTTYLYTLAILLKEQAKTPLEWDEAVSIAARLVGVEPQDARFTQLQSEINEARASQNLEKPSQTPEK